MKQDKYSVIISNFGNRADRFLTGYAEDRTFAELCDSATRVPDLSGVEIVGTWHITPRNVAEVKDQLDSHSLKLVSIIPDHFASQIYGRGAFTSKEPAVRPGRSTTRKRCGHSRRARCGLINVWHGQDGYDYLPGRLQPSANGWGRPAQPRNTGATFAAGVQAERAAQRSTWAMADTLLIAQETGCPTSG